MAQELKAEWGRSLPGDLLKRWPRDADGELVPPALLTKCTGIDMDDVLLVNMLEAYGCLLYTSGLVVEHTARSARDGIDDVHAFGHLAERGVLLVEVRSVHVHDEKLAAGGVRIHGAGHGQHAAGVLEVVLEAVARELALDAVARAAHAGAGRVAALDHEAGDDAVEDHAVVKDVYKRQISNRLRPLSRVRSAVMF